MPFEPRRDFVPVGLMVYVPYLLVVNPALPARSVKDLIELAKAQPGRLNFASPGFDCNTWYGLLAPTGTPPAIVAKFNAELNRALANPGVIQRLLEQGVEATPGTSAAFRELIVAENQRWRMVIKSAGITADVAQ
jgi:tripartite-type tricarboxylate transporter receptor subunit TctC